MKKKTTCLIFAAFISLQMMTAQCELNTPLGSTVNIWDWRVEQYDLYIDVPGDYVYENATSPFHSTSYSLQPNVAHLTFHPGEPNDYEPFDGWELLYKNFGTPEEPIAEPSFALYNRYSGLLRTFIWLTAGGEFPYQTAMIKVEQSSSLFGNKSGLLELLNSPANALDQFDTDLELNSFNAYTEQDGTWVFHEFTAAYDPCTCNHSSGIIISPTLSSVQNVTLDIMGTGNSIPVVENNVAVTTSENGFHTIVGEIDNLTGGIEKGYKSYKDLNSFVTFYQDNLESIITEPLASMPISLPNWLNGLPHIGAIATFLESLFGGGSSSAPARPVIYQNSFDLNATGNIQTETPYQANLLYTPGSKTEDENGLPIPGLPEANIPIYHNTLGVMNILETPTILKAMGEEEVQIWDTDLNDFYNYWIWYDSYKLDHFPSYTINTDAGIFDIPKSAQAALFFDECIGNNFSTNLILHQTDSDGNQTWRTPFMDIACLPNYTVFFNTQLDDIGSDVCNGNIWMEVNFILQRNPTPISGDTDILFKAAFYTMTQTADYDYENTPPNPFPVMDGISNPFLCGFMPQAITSNGRGLEDFCDNKYDPTRTKITSEDPPNIRNSNSGVGEEDHVTNESHIRLNIYPNPTNGNFEIDIESNNFEVSIFNALGLKIYEQNHQSTVSLNSSEWTKGIYLIKVRDFENNSSTVEKLIVN